MVEVIKCIWKMYPGGIIHRRREPKQLIHYTNDIHPEWCLMKLYLYKLYMSKCPVGHPDGAFYLKPLTKPTDICWYHITPIGHNNYRKLCI